MLAHELSYFSVFFFLFPFFFFFFFFPSAILLLDSMFLWYSNGLVLAGSTFCSFVYIAEFRICFSHFPCTSSGVSTFLSELSLTELIGMWANICWTYWRKCIELDHLLLFQQLEYSAQVVSHSFYFTNIQYFNYSRRIVYCLFTCVGFRVFVGIANLGVNLLSLLFWDI